MPQQTTAEGDATVSTGVDNFDRFTRAFESSARRWELVVYPSLFAFVVLAAYGFYLIYNLSHDIHQLTVQVTEMNVSVTKMSSDMNIVAGNMQVTSLRMSEVAATMSDVSFKLNSLEPMLENMTAMNQSAQSMDRSARAVSISSDQMRHQMGFMNNGLYKMNRSFTPGGMMANFMPW